MTEEKDQVQEEEGYPVKITIAMSDGMERVIDPEKDGVGVCLLVMTPDPVEKSTNAEVMLNASVDAMAMGVATVLLKNPDIFPRVLKYVASQKDSQIQVVRLPINLPGVPPGVTH